MVHIIFDEHDVAAVVRNLQFFKMGETYPVDDEDTDEDVDDD